MPALESGALNTLDSLLVPSAAQDAPTTRLRKKRKVDCDIVADVPEEPAPLQGPSHMIVFRLMHVSPKQQKLMRSPASSLRGDHIAVSVANIESRCRATRSMTVSGERHGAVSSIRVFSLSSFLELGMPRLSQGFLRCVLSPSVVYNFTGTSLDSVCHGVAGQQAITQLVDANAVPAGDLFDSTTASQDLLDMFRLFESEGLVASLDNGRCWQLTSRGAASLRYSSQCVDFQRFYVPRRVALSDRTHWERTKKRNMQHIFIYICTYAYIHYTFIYRYTIRCVHTFLTCL